MNFAPDDEWNDEVSKTAFEYIKVTLKEGSPEQKKSIRNKYKGLSEYKKARKELR